MSLYQYVCHKCKTKFTTKKRNQKYCSKSCANSQNSINRKIEDESIFLDGFNNISAYILGIILSDGCLSYDRHSKRYRITISMNEHNLIKYLRDRYAPTKKVYEYKNVKGNSTTYTFITTNKYDVEFIKLIGISERKSKYLIFPEIDDAYIRDVIRGVFDGDGSVYINKTKFSGKVYRYLNASFTTGSEHFADDIIEILRINDINAHKVKDSRKERNCWYVKIYSQKDMKRFHEFMYNGAVLYLNRKKDLFNMMI